MTDHFGSISELGKEARGTLNSAPGKVVSRLHFQFVCDFFLLLLLPGAGFAVDRQFFFGWERRLQLLSLLLLSRAKHGIMPGYRQNGVGHPPNGHLSKLFSIILFYFLSVIINGFIILAKHSNSNAYTNVQEKRFQIMGFRILIRRKFWNGID